MKNDPILLAFCGFSRSGKNFTADALQDYLRINHNILATQHSFAQPLKDLTHALYPDLPEDKSIPEVREAYQNTGSLLRHHLTPNVFIYALDEEIEDHAEHSTQQPSVHLITDLRYVNEAEYVLTANEKNRIIHIERPGNKPANMHDSELSHLRLINDDGTYIDPRILGILNNNNPDAFTKVFKKIAGTIIN